jgi:hypothetical protein
MDGSLFAYQQLGGLTEQAQRQKRTTPKAFLLEYGHSIHHSQRHAQVNRKRD